MASSGPQVAAYPGAAAGFPAGFPAGYGSMPGAFYGTQQIGDSIVDRYVVPGDVAHIPEPVQVQSFTTVMDNQVYMEPKQVPIKVPRTIMEDFEVSYQVPAYETRTHTAQRPKVVMEEQTITVQEPRTVMEPVPIQVPAVQTVGVIQQHHKVVEYERPRMIPGRYVRTYAGPTQTVGYTQGQIYQTGTYGAAVTGVAPVAGSAAPATGYITGSAAPVATGVVPTAYGYGYPMQYGMPYGYPAPAAAPK